MKINEDAFYRNHIINLSKAITEELQSKLRSIISNEELYLIQEYPSKSQNIEVENTEIFEKAKESWKLPIKVNNEYPEIIFEFVLNPSKINQKSNISFSYNKNTHNIIMPVLSLDEIEGLYLSLCDLYILIKSKRLENILVHEITHWIDFMRTNNKIRFNTEEDLKKYYNCDAELNSFTNDVISYIEQEGKNITNKTNREIVNKVIHSDNFIRRYGELLSYLNTRNKKKLIKRIYDYFDTFKQVFECIQERFDLYDYNEDMFILYENYYRNNNMKELLEDICKEKERIENGKLF